MRQTAGIFISIWLGTGISRLDQAGNSGRCFLHFAFRLRATVLDGLGDAVTKMIFEQPERNRLQRPRHRGDLRQDVNTVDVRFHHPLKAADLTLDPAQTLEVGVLILRITSHNTQL